jgi:methionyl-tRNA formyltransferase
MRSHVSPEPANAAPGTIIDVSSGSIHVATGYGERLAIDEVQPEGRRTMKVRDYLAGHPIQPGARLGSP